MTTDRCGDYSGDVSIKWTRSEDGYTESKCGRFAIHPEFYGTTRAQSYGLHGNEPLPYRLGSHDTQAHAKIAAEEFLSRAAMETP